MSEPGPPFLSDLSLSRRLETTEARASAAFVEARARLSPNVAATWREIGGTFAMFDGPTSPITQTFRLGMSQPVEPGQLGEIEDFFRERGAPVCHEVSPLADASALALLTKGGYHPVEFTSVMFRPLRRNTTREPTTGSHIAVRQMTDADIPTWIETAVAGWSEFAELADLMRELARVSAERKDGLCFLAERDGSAVATGGLFISDGVALFAGASTIPAARHQGAQLALLERRLEVAIDAGCDLAMMCALPGSGSQRNAERHGFRIAYTRIKWALAPSA